MTRKSRRLLTAAGCLVLLGLSVSVPASAEGDAGGSDAGVTPAGTIARPPGCGGDFFVVDDSLHLLIDVRATGSGTGDCPGDNSPQSVQLISWSTATLAKLGTATAKGLTRISMVSRPVVDQVHHRLFFASNPYPNFQLVGFDTRALLHPSGSIAPVITGDIPQQPPATAASAQDPLGTLSDTSTLETLQPVGISYDPASDRVDIVTVTSQSLASLNAPGTAAQDVYLVESGGSDGTVKWVFRVAGLCSTSQQFAAPTTNLASPVMHVHTSSGDTVAIGCLYYAPGNSYGKNTGAPDGPMVTSVVQLGSDGAPTGTTRNYLGRAGDQSGIAVPELKRIFYGAAPLAGSGATAAGPSAVLFDLDHTAYIGATTVSGPDAAYGGYTMAAGGGRLYGAGPGGIVVIDARQTPLGQGLVYPLYSCYARNAMVDSSNRRLFVIPYDKCKDHSNIFTFSKMQVFQDDSQFLLPSDIPPDNYTSDAPETSSSTVSYNGHASATGLKMRLVGGSRAVVDNETLGYYGLLTDGLSQPLDSETRTVNLADISAGDLDNYQASGVADSVLADDSTRGQYEGSALQQGQPYPFKQAACSAPGIAQKQTAYHGEVAEVHCDNETGVTASAVASSMRLVTDGSLSIDVGHAEVSTSTLKNGTDGMVVTSSSTVHGITLGAIHIDAVTSSVTCKAHGHKATASCDYQRTISGVTDASGVVGPGQCADDSAVNTDTCGKLVDQLNGLYEGRLVFKLPLPDRRNGYLGGSPGGYQAVCQRELYESLQDLTLNYDRSLQVPALEVLYVDDSQTSPSRSDLQLANVQAEALYGVLPGSTDLGGGDLGGDQSPPDTGTLGPGAPILAATPPVPPTPPVVTPKTPQRPPLVTLLNKVWDGARLLGRSPGTTMLVASLLAILGAPMLIAWRRRRLLVALQEGMA